MAQKPVRVALYLSPEALRLVDSCRDWKKSPAEGGSELWQVREHRVSRSEAAEELLRLAGRAVAGELRPAPIALPPCSCAEGEVCDACRGPEDDGDK